MNDLDQSEGPTHTNLDTYSEFIHISRYAKYRDDLGRRETWPETVTRYFDFITEHLEENHSYKIPEKLKNEVQTAVLNHEVLPSMRLLTAAGAAAKREPLSAYNCSYLPIDNTRAFDEILYILMCGVGVGFSVERQYINQLPVINEHFEYSSSVIVVEDSKAGWARALRELIAMLYSGQIPKWDLSKLRPAGARLKTFGGRSSGPGPLEDVFKYVVQLFRNAAGRKLTSAECHDLVCTIAGCVVVGGVRRSALISLSNLSDDRMRTAKSGEWWKIKPERAYANNSAVYTEKPDMGIFMKEWMALYESKSGERGIFNREGAVKQVKKTNRRTFEDYQEHFGVNPCGEIILRPNGLCNLSNVIIRSTDTYEDLVRKIKLASILGTWQSTLTNFKYLRKVWQRNAEEERLLGIGLSGIMDHEVMNGKSWFTDGGVSFGLASVLDSLKQHAIEQNITTAKEIGITQSMAVTCVKPDGNSSQFVGSSSGIHPRYSPYYIRTVRANIDDPLVKFMKDKGFTMEACLTDPQKTVVISFPIKSPEGAIFRNDMNALEQLKLWLSYKQYWTEHNPSITVYVKENEWMEVGAWVYKNFDEICGLSFLPFSDHTYRQAPYQEISQDEYEDLVSKMPKNIDWTELQNYEKEDNTVSSQSLTCSSGACDILDLV